MPQLYTACVYSPNRTLQVAKAAHCTRTLLDTSHTVQLVPAAVVGAAAAAAAAVGGSDELHLHRDTRIDHLPHRCCTVPYVSR